MTYYTLAVKEGGIWFPEFGDYCRSTVVQEGRDSYAYQPRKILKTDGQASSIEAAVAALNTK